MTKWQITKPKYVASRNLSKVIKKKNKETVTILPEHKFCFTGCGEGEKVNDKASNAEHVKPNKGAQLPKQKDNDRIIINITRKEV